MPNSFDFSQVGKRIPYRLTEGSFEEMQAQVMARIEGNRPTATPTDAKTMTRLAAPAAASRRKGWALFAQSFAVAAALVGVCFLLHPLVSSRPADNVSMAQEIEAYNQLSAEDQAFLIELYEDDLLLNYDPNSNQQ